MVEQRRVFEKPPWQGRKSDCEGAVGRKDVEICACAGVVPLLAAACRQRVYESG